MSVEQSIISIDTDAEIAAIIAKLNKLPDMIAAPNILKNALTATARKVRRQIVKDAEGHYAIKDKGILKDESQGAPKVFSASTSDLTATVFSKGPMQDIMSFMTAPNTDTGAAAAQVLNSGSLKALEYGNLKAFVTKFKSGHVAIVQRRGKERLPVKKLLSPSVPHMLGNGEVRAQAEALTYDTLQAEIRKRIEKVIT